MPASHVLKGGSRLGGMETNSWLGRLQNKKPIWKFVSLSLGFVPGVMIGDFPIRANIANFGQSSEKDFEQGMILNSLPAT